MRIGPIFVNRRIGNLIAHTRRGLRDHANHQRKGQSSVADEDRRNPLAADAETQLGGMQRKT